MSDTQAGKPAPDPAEKTPFASWLDSIVPTVFRSDAEFARRVGVDQSYVHYWRRGRRPQVPALVKISEVTGTSLETLLRIVGYDAGDGHAPESRLHLRPQPVRVDPAARRAPGRCTACLG